MARQGEPVVNDLGLTVLYQGLNPIVDIVFVHGFTGHPHSTWTAKHKTYPPPTDGSMVGIVSSSGSEDVVQTGPQFGKPLPSRLRSIFSSGKSKSVQSPPSIPVDSSSVDLSTTELAGHRDGVFWPYHLLKETVADARILTYGYDTKIRHSAMSPISQNTVGDHGWNLLCDIVDMRREHATRPLIFVAHSLGGLLVKAALKRARDEERGKPSHHQILLSTRAVLFFATPHRGANPRGLLEHALISILTAVGFKYNKRVVDTLLPGGDYLRDLRDSFNVSARTFKWLIFCFQEEYGLPALRGKKVVEDDSSCLEELCELETHRHISSNHMDICRFSGLLDSKYRPVAAAFARTLEVVRLSTAATDFKDTLYQPMDPGAPGEVTKAINSISTKPRDLPEIVLHATSRKTTMPVSRSVDVKDDVAQAPMEAIFEGLIDQLRFDEMENRLNNLRLAHSTTCRWFLQKQAYIDWLDPAQLSHHHCFLWIKGKPGVGKSILMKFLFLHAKEKLEPGNDTVVISFFFNARGSDLEKSPLGLYRALLLDLLERALNINRVIGHLSNRTRLSIMKQGWPLELLKDTIKNSISLLLQHQRLIIFVDALDECDEVQIEDMISFFKDLSAHFSESQHCLHICFSSRHYPTIRVTKGIEVILENENDHLADIAAFVNANLEVNDPEQAPAVAREIVAKSAGIFLWAALVVPILNREYAAGRIYAVQRRLNEIPEKLNGLFQIILTRDGQNLQEFRLAIQWTLFASSPLQLEEYYYAMALGSGENISTKWIRENISQDDMRRFVSSSSKGLIETTKSQTVQFIHESVRDFLLEGATALLWSNLGVDFRGHGHEVLKTCCLQELKKFPDFSTDHISSARPLLPNMLYKKLPFTEYAVKNVLKHAEMACRFGLAQKGFLGSFPFSSWSAVYKKIFGEDFHTGTLLDILIKLQATSLLSEIVQFLTPANPPDWGDKTNESTAPSCDLTLSTSPTECVRWGCFPDALFLLVEYGDTAVLRRFLENKFLFPHDLRDSRLSKYLNNVRRISELPLEAAKSEEIAQTLMDYGANPVSDELKDREWNPLKLAVSAQFAKNMLDYGIDPNAKLGEHGNPPLFQCNTPEVIKILLERGADANARDGQGRTPLFDQASRPQTLEITRLLIDHGADVNARHKFGHSALFTTQSAAVANYLLENGAELYLQNCVGRTALHWAMWRAIERLSIPFSNRILGKALTGPESETLEVIRLLVSKGIGVDIAALWDAALYGPLEVLEALSIQPRDGLASQAGYQGDTNDSGCEQPLDFILDRADPALYIYRGNVENAHEFVRLLLRHNAIEPNRKDPRGWTVLHKAAGRGLSPLLIQAFLSNPRVDVSAQSATGSTAFHEAVRASCSSWRRDPQRLKGLCQAFLSCDRVDVNARNFGGKTPLHYSAEQYDGVGDTTAVLLSSPRVDPDARDDEGATALHLAIQRARLGVVRILAKSERVNMNIKDEIGNTPLHYASMHGSPFAEELLDVLLSNPKLEVNLKDNNGRTPLHIAALRGCSASVIRLCADTRVDLNATDYRGQTPLTYATQGSLVVTMLLIECPNVELNARDADGYTPLHLAILGDRQWAVKALCAKPDRLDFGIVDSYGRSPWELAKRMSLIWAMDELERCMHAQGGAQEVHGAGSA